MLGREGPATLVGWLASTCERVRQVQASPGLANRPQKLHWSFVFWLSFALALAGCGSAPERSLVRLPQTVLIEDEDGDELTLLVQPVDRGRLTSGFGWRGHPTGGRNARHDGLDFAAPRGTKIRAAGAGRVVEMTRQRGYGRLLRIRHTSRFETVYAHLAGYADHLRVGKRVRQGELVGYVGATGNATGPHLHYEIRKHGKAVDPLGLSG